MFNIDVKILNVTELNDFREIRLSALKQCSKMFGSTYAVEIEKPLKFFENCLLSLTIFGAYYENKIIGMATLIQEMGIKFAHKAYLSSMFVEPIFQRKGIASQLMNAIIKDRKKQIEQILLTVAADNQPAIHLYEKLGFQTYGVELKALKENGKYVDELLMKRIIL